MLYDLKFMDGKLYHLLTFETSGTLTVTGSWAGDIWLCGAGAPGMSPYVGGDILGVSYSAWCGAGAGYVNNQSNISILSGDIVIGASPMPITGVLAVTQAITGGTTSYAGFSALGGCSDGTGGSSGGVARGHSQIASGGVSTRPFLSNDMPKHCGAGGAPLLYNSIHTSSSSNAGDGGEDGGQGSVGVQGNGAAGKGGEGGGSGGGSPSYYDYSGTYYDNGQNLGGRNGGAGIKRPYEIVGEGGGFGYGGGGGAPAGLGTAGAVMIRIPA